MCFISLVRALGQLAKGVSHISPISRPYICLPLEVIFYFGEDRSSTDPENINEIHVMYL